MKNVNFKDETKEKLVNGVQLIADAVRTTYGPNGKNVIIRRGNDVHVTKDGMTVATYVTSEDPIEQMAIDLVKQAAQKTAKDVGDGTTTTVVLTNAIVQKYKDNPEPIKVQRLLQDYQKQIIEYLEKNKKEISSFEDIKKVATIAANNDEKLGTLIAEAYDKVGKFGIVTIGESSSIEDSYEYVSGFMIESGYASPFFINTDNDKCVLENVLVYATSESIKTQKELQQIADRALREGKALLIVATKLEDNLQQALLLNKQMARLQSCFVKAPLHGIYKESVIEDLNITVGETMTCDRVEVDKDKTVLIGCHPSEEINSRIISVQNQLKNIDLAENEVELLTKRLASLTGGVCTIKVGGYSEAEIKEKTDRVEDAICATKAALEGGVLPGAGKALYNAAIELKNDFCDVLTTPVLVLGTECKSTRFLRIYNEFWSGMDARNGEQCDLYKDGIIEPFLVTKTALENAISTATIILTNECSIIYKI